MVYTVGEIAKKLNIPTSTLRYYDKEGLLPFVERSTSGIRMFRDEDLDWLEIIECLKYTGMPLKDIKAFIDYCIEGDSRLQDRLQIILDQRKRVLEQIATLQSSLNLLDFKAWYYGEANAAGTTEIHDYRDPSTIPLEYHKYFERKWAYEEKQKGKTTAL